MYHHQARIASRTALGFATAFIGLQAALLSSTCASEVFVEKAIGTGVSEEDLTAATELVSTSVGSVDSNHLTAQAGQADIILRPKLIRLGAGVVLSLSKSVNGKEVYSGQLKAQKMDELDEVASSLTRTVLQGDHSSEGPQVDEITKEEANQVVNRRPARRNLYLGFGGASFSNLNTSSIGYGIVAGYSWDLNRARIKLLADGALNGNALALSGGLGASYFFTLSDISPYIGVDFGAGFAKSNAANAIDGESVGGFVAGVGAGIELFRTSTVNLDIGLRAGYLLSSNSLGTPSVYVLRIGIYY